MENITPDSAVEEILAVAKKHAEGGPGLGSGHEMKLSFALTVLNAKYQKQIINDQNQFNKKLISWTAWVAIGTWVLAIATILLVCFHA
jgi:hypothetical protein